MDSAGEGGSGGGTTDTHACPGGVDGENRRGRCGDLKCGAESCCESLLVPGGTMIRTEDILDGGVAELIVAPFLLDKFEVTVGRFRQYIEDYDRARPAEDDGAHPLIPYSGWYGWFDGFLPATQSDLLTWIHCQNYTVPTPANHHCIPRILCECQSQTEWVTWTDAAGPNESLPVNFVNWYMAFAFCIWDGGRLPTEGEWEFAAAGGAERRVYPWGDAPPTPEYANYGAEGDAPFAGLVPVGTRPLGNGRWGHSDLAGNAAEWVLDYASESLPASCENCANLEAQVPVDATELSRVVRGGWARGGPTDIRVAARGIGPPDGSGVGFRCARDVVGK